MVTSLPMATEILPAEAGEAEGCVQCQIGSKLVLFVTGKCHWGCDYCPLSDNRRESPDMFANERRCATWQDVIDFYLNYGFEITHYSDGDAYFKLNLANFLIQVIKDYQAPYPDPIQAKQGEIITLDMQKETPIAGWVWCTSSSGKSGWVPESYIEIQDNLTGEMRCDYDAIELTIHKGDVLTVLKRESDFYWARNEKEQEGWIPIAHTDLYRK